MREIGRQISTTDDSSYMKNWWLDNFGDSASIQLLFHMDHKLSQRPRIFIDWLKEEKIF